ncbi:hypothetical protein Aoki45_13350 [Algoriphagus sp. oki45]|uniref:hypothetical protein n=1 Tax=Algoriphagus sp. oki45 TaxID=3067294 RepID=UPI0027F6E7E2|nr:hypothetical protein Aoki45_13350 [Algoriphagus sp. oki45]
MKVSLCFFATFLISHLCFSQEYLDGYYLLHGQDTIYSKIKVGGKKISSGYYFLVIPGQEPGSKDIVYAVKEKKVAGYGIYYMGKWEDYRYVKVENSNDQGFYRQIEYGPNYLLYVLMVSTNVNGIVTTLPQYALFKPEGEFVVLTTNVLGNWKKNLKKILQDNPEALAQVDQVGRNEIPEFIEKLNRGD